MHVYAHLASMDGHAWFCWQICGLPACGGGVQESCCMYVGCPGGVHTVGPVTLKHMHVRYSNVRSDVKCNIRSRCAQRPASCPSHVVSMQQTQDGRTHCVIFVLSKYFLVSNDQASETAQHKRIKIIWAQTYNQRQRTTSLT